MVVNKGSGDGNQARGVTRHPEHLVPEKAEEAYNLLTSYRFAQRYAAGRSVADLGMEQLGYGTRMLGEVAASVVGLTDSPNLLEQARAYYPAPNVDYRRTSSTGFSQEEQQFDLVVALKVLETQEHPEKLLKAVKRSLKQDGVLVISTVNKQTYSNERNHRDSAHEKEMYLPEFRELLGKHFEQVRICYQGTIAGTTVSSDALPCEAANVVLESAPLSSTAPAFVSGLPPAPHVLIAVCSDSEVTEEIEQPYLLLDRDRRVFDEYEDHRKDIQLLRDEILHMQETEVQAFKDTLMVRDSEIRRLRVQLDRSKAELQRLSRRLEGIENSRSWRMLGVYRRMRMELNSMRSPKRPE